MQTHATRPDPHRRQRGAALIGIAGLAALGLGATLVHGFGNTPEADAVSEWNRIGIDAGAALERGTSEQRELTMMHLAIHDALHSIRPVYASYVAPTRMHPDALPDAAIATAAHDVLVATVPMKRTALDTSYNDALARLPAGAPRDEGVRAGHEAASAIIDKRAHDRSDAADIAWDGKPGIGQWETTPPNHLKALLPGWRFVTPFAIHAADQFLPPPPPALDSAEYARQYAAVKGLGGQTTTSRTDDQGEIARFWAGNVNDAWNEIARKTIAANAPKRRDELATWRNARTFALLNMAMADGFVSGWNAKDHYHDGRPVTAIPRGDADGNPATVPDAGWTSYLPTPEH
ncbi:MAG TPA: vanadium-dependent haloperoxidase, partial [Lysobacter sp.]